MHIIVQQAIAAVSFPTRHLTIESNGVSHYVIIEVASNPQQLEYGLMNRPMLAKGHGMLFDFGAEKSIQMWMKDTLMPLDMLFMDAAGNIIYIKERAKPQSLENISANRPVRAVLELPGGAAGILQLKPGDSVVYPIFSQH